MERLTANIKGKTEMICRFEDCMTDEDICPYTNERDCPCMQAVIKKLARYEDAEERESKWIPCSERLPEYGEVVMCSCTNGGITISCITHKGVIPSKSVRFGQHSVIAWQPLPQPYQPSGNHKKKTNFDRCCESMEAMAQVIDIAKVGWTKEQIMEWLQKEVCEVPE